MLFMGTKKNIKEGGLGGAGPSCSNGGWRVSSSSLM